LAAARAVVRRGASRGVGSSDSPPSRVPALTARHHAPPPNRCAMPACGLIVQLTELTTEFRAVPEHLVRLNGAIARHETEVVALKLRAAARDAMCPLVEVLREEVQGIQAAILKDLQAARDMVVERKAEVEVEERWENRLMPFIRPALIALISALLTLIVIHGQEILKGWAGKVP